jgi:hypothetical protein
MILTKAHTFFNVKCFYMNRGKLEQIVIVWVFSPLLDEGRLFVF